MSTVVYEVDNPARVLRFYAKIKIDLPDLCWPWIAGIDRKGYGIFKVNAKTCSKAHIFSFLLHHGPVPPGMQVDHECHLHACQNPAHLRPLSNLDNNARSQSPSAVNARKTACIRGHTFDEENTIRDKHGHRHCRTCERERGR